jgi:hypothetical protein
MAPHAEPLNERDPPRKALLYHVTQFSATSTQTLDHYLAQIQALSPTHRIPFRDAASREAFNGLLARLIEAFGVPEVPMAPLAETLNERGVLRNALHDAFSAYD